MTKKLLALLLSLLLLTALAPAAAAEDNRTDAEPDAVIGGETDVPNAGTQMTGTVEWNSADVQYKGTTPYVMYNKKAQTPRFAVKDSNGKTVDAKYYTYRYQENTQPGTGYVTVTFQNGYTGSCQGAFKIYLPATAKTTVQNVQNGIKITWDAVEGAAGYVIYRRAWNSSAGGWSAFARWNNVTGTTWTDGTDDAHKVYAGTRYQYGVKAYFAKRYDPVAKAYIGGNENALLGNYNLGVVGPIATTVRLTTRVLNEVDAGSGQLTARWDASKNCSGYRVQIATDANFSKIIKSLKITDPLTASTTVKGLTNGTEYYVRVLSYQDFDGVTYYGQWSNVLSNKPGSGHASTRAVRRALLIGENSYQDGNVLYGCVNDMNALAGTLKSLRYAYTTKTLPNSTKSQILSAITTFLQDAGENDTSLFYFSGHGTDASSYTGSTYQKYQGALYTVEGGYLTFAELASALSQVKGRVIVVMDSCHSGAAIGKSAGSLTDAFNESAIAAFRGDGETAQWADLANSKFIVITAASYSESSWDGSYDGSGTRQGAFTAAFIKGLGCSYPNGTYSGSMPADTDKNLSVTLKEIYTYASRQAQTWTSGDAQHAQYYGTDSTVLFKR